jgi:hypothetical protein
MAGGAPGHPKETTMQAMQLKCTVIALMIAAQLAPAAQWKSRHIARYGEEWKISYDATRLSWKEAFEIAKLAPDINHTFYTVLTPNGCYSDRPECAPCGTRYCEDLNFFYNAEVAFQDFDQGVSNLASLKLSPSLSTVRDFILKRQKMWRWVNGVTIQYWKERRIELLEESWKEDPGTGNCAATVEKIRHASSETERYKLVFHDWYNCQNDGHRDLLDPGSKYPNESWLKGAAEAGVKVEEIVHPID